VEILIVTTATMDGAWQAYAVTTLETAGIVVFMESIEAAVKILSFINAN